MVELPNIYKLNYLWYSLIFERRVTNLSLDKRLILETSFNDDMVSPPLTTMRDGMYVESAGSTFKHKYI